MANIDKLKAIADLLQLFVREDGFKNLTHDSGREDFLRYLCHARSLILNYKGLVPDHLYRLLFGFVYGPVWVDRHNNEHTFHCSCEECLSWSMNNQGKHPLFDLDSPELFHTEREEFKHSVRVISPDLEDFVINNVPDHRLLETDRLSGAQFYTDTNRLYTVIKKIFDMMSDSRYGNNKDIKVSFIRGEKDPDGYRISKILIEQVGSFSPAPMDDVLSKIQAGGGDLGSLKSLMEGYYLWSIESKWQNTPARLNILTADEFDAPKERLSSDEATGFRHVITIYHKMM
jgi:hypothetical protein